jgi:hypothetical protein
MTSSVTESTTNGMSSVTMSTTVCGEPNRCSSKSGEYTLTAGAPGGRSSARIRCDIAAPYGSCTCRAASSPWATCLQYCPTNVWKSRFCSGVNRSWAYRRISSMISDRSRDGMVGMAILFGPATARSPRRRAARSCGPLPAACARRGGRGTGYGARAASRKSERIASCTIGQMGFMAGEDEVGLRTNSRSDTATPVFLPVSSPRCLTDEASKALVVPAGCFAPPISPRAVPVQRSRWPRAAARPWRGADRGRGPAEEPAELGAVHACISGGGPLTGSGPWTGRSGLAESRLSLTASPSADLRIVNT